MSSTMIAANTTGIPVFVTGGIGGVHRGAQSSEFIVKQTLINSGQHYFMTRVSWGTWPPAN